MGNTLLSLKDLGKYLDAYGKEADRALVSAINKVGAQAITQMTKDVRTHYNIPAARFKKGLKLRKATSYRKEAWINAYGYPIGLANYGARKIKIGVSVQVLKTGRKNIPGMFIANAPGQSTPTVWSRVGSANNKSLPTKGRYRGTGIPRQEVERHVGPSVPQMVRKVGKASAENLIKAKFPGIFEHELKFRLNKL